MDIGQYQHEAVKTAIYPRRYAQTYPLLGLTGEVGEFCNKYKKVLRDDVPINQNDIAAELGDILWYIAVLASDFDLDLEVIAQKNINKLKDRQERGVLGGSGDNR